MKKITFIISIIFCFFSTFAIAIEPPLCGNCEEIQAVGNAWVNTDQNLGTELYVPSCGNYISLTDSGNQYISGHGVGDSGISVSGYGYLGQEGPYSKGIEVPNGTATLSGDSVMEITGSAGTDPYCQEFDMDLAAGRVSNTYIIINPDNMNASLDSGGNFSGDIVGATDFGVNLDAIDGYSTTAGDNGRSMAGQTRITISGGSFGN